ncbi:hypothetical protein HJ590_17605 [Naumannella sp. ID2617S]|nr:hypothetical protein [Naumannella sp. ID2617S]
MRRFLATICAVTLLGGCSGNTAAAPPAAPPAGTPTAAGDGASATPTAAPTTASAGVTPTSSTTPTDPEKLDRGLLRPEQLPGWRPAEFTDEPVDARVDPPACSTVYDQSLGKVASDMGATVAYTQDPLFLQEFVDLVDNGAKSVGEIEQSVGQCKEFTVDENGEVTKFTATPIPVPALGDKAFGLRLGVTGAEPAELLYVWVGHKDTLMMLHIDGDKVDQAQLVDMATRATDTLRAAI